MSCFPCFPCFVVKIPPFSRHCFIFSHVSPFLHRHSYSFPSFLLLHSHFFKIHITISVLLLLTINSNMVIFCTIIFVLLLFTITACSPHFGPVFHHPPGHRLVAELRSFTEVFRGHGLAQGFQHAAPGERLIN